MINNLTATKGRRGQMAWAAVLLGILLGVMMMGANVYGAAAVGPVIGSTGVSGVPVQRNTMGSPNARVQVIIYNDFQCVYCGKLHAEAEAQIIEQYVQTGKARLEVRQYPTYGEESVRAAEAAMAAADQGKYWEYRDLLWRNRKGVNRGNFSDENLIRLASELGLDLEKFSAALVTGSHLDEVEADLQEAEAAGVNSVPTVFINGRRLEGAQPFAAYQRIIDEELNK